MGYSGAWTLVCTPPAPAVTFHQVKQAICQIKERPGGGRSPLVERVRDSWAQQGDAAGGKDSAEALLATAAHLCLLPPASSGGLGTDNRLAVWGAPSTAMAAAAAAAVAAVGRSNGLSAKRLLALLQQRGVALVAAEVGDGPVPVPPPEHPEDWPEWSVEVEAPLPSKPAAGQQAGGPGEQRTQRSWEAERDAALGLVPRPPPADDPAADIGRLDPLSGQVGGGCFVAPRADVPACLLRCAAG